MRLWVLIVISLVAVAGLVFALQLSQEDAGVREGDLILYCAAGMMKPVQEIAKEYEEKYDVRVQIEPGGSGKLLATIRANPERGDLYLAADKSYIDRAREEYGLVAESMPAGYLKPVLAVEPGNPLDITSADALYDPEINVALANPELASVGQTTQEALEPSGVWAKIMQKKDEGGARVSFTGTVNEVAQAIKLGGADVGVIWDSLARQYDLEIVEDERLDAFENTITVSVLTASKQPTAALQFARYLTSRDQGMPKFEKHEFRPIENADVWEEHPEIPIMAGAMLKPGVEEAIARFEEREGVKIKPVYNGCGILVSQMKAIHDGSAQGIFPDVYISCDSSFLEQVDGYFEPSVDLSRNPMVIVVPKGNPKEISKLTDLTRDDLVIGLAHPENSALGKLTDDLLKKLDLHDAVYNSGSRVIHTDAGHLLVNQIRTGSLDACIVYLSNARSVPDWETQFDIHEIPLEEAVATQPFAVSKDSEHRHLMYRLRDTITAAQTADRFEELGFDWIYSSSE